MVESAVKANRILIPLSVMLSGASAQESVLLTKQDIAQQLPGVEAHEIFDSPLEGFYEVAVGSNIGYISTDGRYYIQGELYDLGASENLTEKRRARARVDVMAGIDPETMIVFAPQPEDVKHSVTVFTDIDCGYCRQFHREIAQVNALGIEVRYIAYPRTGPDTDSWDKADRVWCAANRRDALTQAKLGGQLPERSCAATPVAAHYDVGHLVGVRGTPTILAMDGTQLGGYLTPAELLALLEAQSAPAE
jgi:thiol:disulfide interchange protein DsbC